MYQQSGLKEPKRWHGNNIEKRSCLACYYLSKMFTIDGEMMMALFYMAWCI